MPEISQSLSHAQKKSCLVNDFFFLLPSTIISTTPNNMAELHLSILSEDEKPEITIKDPNISTSKNQAPPPKTPSRTRERFTKEDMQFVLTWLEHRPNFTSVFGSSGQATVGKPIKTKASGYSALAGAVSEQSKGRLNVNGKNMRDRFRRHMKLYTSTKMGAQSICFFVTPQDNRRGIYTVAQKLEDLCTCYARMDVLFGHQPNVTPRPKLMLVLHLLKSRMNARSPAQHLNTVVDW